MKEKLTIVKHTMVGGQEWKVDEPLDFIQYVALGLRFAAPVGPVNIELINRGMNGGFNPSWFFGLGGLTSNLCFIFFIYFGFSYWWQQPIVEISSYFIGALMLFILGFTSIQSIFSKKTQTTQSSVSSFLIGFLLGFANPIHFNSWFSGYGTALHTWLVEMSVIKIFTGSFWILFGVLLWYSNLAFIVHFIKRKLNIKLMQILSYLLGMMLLWFCSEYLRKIAEILFNW